jgi:hypothetical protein
VGSLKWDKGVIGDMRTKAVFVVALSLSMGVLVVQMAGFGAVTGTPPAAGMEAGEQIREQANESVANTGLKGGARSSDGELVGVIISGIKNVVPTIVKTVALMPFVLSDLGFPWYAAAPIGFFSEIVIGIGIIQFATNRKFE